MVVGGIAQDKNGIESVTRSNGTVMERRRIVEGTIVKVPAWTGVGEKSRWLADLIDACKACTGRTDILERGWILEIIKEGMTKERLD